jgi:hypothetical protein
MNEFQWVAVFSAMLALLAGLWDAWRIRRRQRYSTPALVVGAAGPVVSLVLYLALTDLRLKDSATVALAGGGAVVGMAAAAFARLSRVENGAIRLNGAAWLPLPAALAVAAVQFCAAAESLAGMILAIAALEAAAGFGVGAVLMLMLRRALVRGTSGATTGGAPASAALLRP